MAQNIYIKGTQNDWYEDATFRVKDEYVNNTPTNLANYADELISNHMKTKGYSEYTSAVYTKQEMLKKKQLYDTIEWFCWISLAFLAVVLGVCLVI